MASKAAKEIEVEVAKLVPWKAQPRRTANTEGLEGLSQSLLEQGQLQALTVRPAKKNTFEVICGGRRLYAAKKAKLSTLRVLVREDLVDNDELAREVALTENLQREDVPPLEEADGIGALRDRGKSVDEIATRLGRSPAYVYRRLALCELGEMCRKALVAGDMNLGAAEVLATVPKGKQQDQAFKEMSRWRAPWDRRTALDIVHRGFRLELSGARWQLDDAALVAKAGPCTSCPKRSGAQPALFEDEKSATDRCLDRECFDSKREAHSKSVLDAAKKDGKAILSTADAKKLWPHEHSAIDRGAAYLDLDQPHDYGGKKWRNALGKNRLPEEITVAVNPHTGEVHELVSRAAVQKALAAAPKKGDPSAERPKYSTGGYKPSAAEKKRKLVAKAKATAHKRAAKELREKLAQPLTGTLEDLLVLVGAGILTRMYYGEPIERCAARRGWTKDSADEPRVVMLRAIAGSAQQMTAVIVEMLVEQQLRDFAEATGRRGAGADPESFISRVMGHMGVDWLAHEKTALEELEGRLAKKAGKKSSRKTAPADVDEDLEDDAGDEADE